MKGGGGGSSIPNDYTFKFGGTAGPTIQVDTELDNIHVKELPRFEIAFLPVTVNSNIAVKEFVPVTVNSNIAVKELPTVKTELAITEIPPITSNLNIAVKEIPEQRYQYPAHYQVGFSLFGIEIWKVSLCGEAQAINEKYVPRRTEHCK